jgi:hypothetical protein
MGVMINPGSIIVRIKRRLFTAVPDRGLGCTIGVSKISHQVFESQDKGVQVGIRGTWRFR